MNSQRPDKGFVLLINPRLPLPPNELNIPLGLMAIGGFIDTFEYAVDIIDENNFADKRVFFNAVESLLPRALCVGLSVMSSQVPAALAVSQFIKRHASGLKVIWGGVHPTLYPGQTASSKYIDVAVRGEGEETFLEILAALREKKAWDDIRGIAFADHERGIVITDERPFLDMNSLPPTNWDLLSDVRALGGLGNAARRVRGGVPLQTSRGCPHQCVFCINSLRREKYRARDPALVMRDIDSLSAQGVNRIFFIDEMFFIRLGRVQALMSLIESKATRFSWFASLRSDFIRRTKVSPDFFRELRRAGFATAGIGAESGSDRVLALLKKGANRSDILLTARFLHEAGVSANFSFMIGLPGETPEDMKKTINLIVKLCRMDANFIILGPQLYRPYPGSILYEQCLAWGMREPESLEAWAASDYIKGTVIGRAAEKYPWVQYPLNKLHNLIFYASRINRKFRSRFFTFFIRKLFIARCQTFCFILPMERWLFELIRRSKRISSRLFGN